MPALEDRAGSIAAVTICLLVCLDVENGGLLALFENFDLSASKKKKKQSKLNQLFHSVDT